MAHVVYQGRDLGEVSDPALVDYYRRETDTYIDGVLTTAGVVPPAQRLTKADLQQQARDLGLDDSGTKADLEARIAEHETSGAVVEQVEVIDPQGDGLPPDVEQVEAG